MRKTQARLEARLSFFIQTSGALAIEENFAALRLYRTIQRVKAFKYKLMEAENENQTK